MTERVEAGRLYRRTVQILETLYVVDIVNTVNQGMRAREIESDVKYGEDTLPEPLFNSFFDALLDALLGEVLGKG